MTNEYIERLESEHKIAVDRVVELEAKSAQVLVAYAKFFAAFEASIKPLNSDSDDTLIEQAKIASTYLLDLYERLVPIYADLDALVNKIKPTREEEGD